MKIIDFVVEETGSDIEVFKIDEYGEKHLINREDDISGAVRDNKGYYYDSVEEMLGMMIADFTEYINDDEVICNYYYNVEFTTEEECEA